MHILKSGLSLFMQPHFVELPSESDCPALLKLRTMLSSYLLSELPLIV